MLSYLNIFKESGKEVFVIDYCSSLDKVQNSYDTNRNYGFISFAADQRDLNSIPSLPQPIYSENTNDVLQISDAENFLYIINPEQYSSKSDFLEAISSTRTGKEIIKSNTGTRNGSRSFTATISRMAN